MKNKLLVMILIGMICNAQYYPIRISFNNGEVLQGIGKFKNSATIKYKAHKDAESEEFEVAKIKQVEIMLDRKNISLYRIYQTIENSGFISVVEVVKGGKVQLYKPYWADTGQGNMSMGMAKMTMNATNAGMGMPMGMGMGGFGGGVPLTYYVKSQMMKN